MQQSFLTWCWLVSLVARPLHLSEPYRVHTLFQLAVCCHELTPKAVIPNAGEAAFLACTSRPSLAIVDAGHVMVVECMVT